MKTNRPNIKETMDYLYRRLPMFQRSGKKAFTGKLDNILALTKGLDNPHQKFCSVHVGGTNGKGSTSHMLASILQEAGYKVGLSTSPHLVNYNERIRINGAAILDDVIIDFVEEYKPLIESLEASFFEVNTAMMFWYFAKEAVDLAIIEVGLGGRFDSTNIINPILSVITNIGKDHQEILGDTLPLIAFEKAGIIKENTPIVISESHLETIPVFEEVSSNRKASISFADTRYEIMTYDNECYEVKKLRTKEVKKYPLALKGNYQAKNLLGVLEAIDCLSHRTSQTFKIDQDHIVLGLQKVVSNTHLLGRWQVLANAPLIVCDTAHNVAGLREVITQIQQQNFEKLHLVLGFMSTKDVDGLMPFLPKGALYYLCEPKIPRAMPLQDLILLAQKHQLDFTAIRGVKEAFAKARSEAKKEDMVYVGGSTFVVAEIL